MSEYDRYKLDGDHKMWVLITLAICIAITAIVAMCILNNVNYVAAGYQQCQYLLPGKSDTVTAWQKTCQPVLSFDQNFQPQQN